MINTEIKTFVVRSQRLAGYLMLNGFVLHEIKSNNDGSGRNVFLFANSPDLQKKIEEYKSI